MKKVTLGRRGCKRLGSIVSLNSLYVGLSRVRQGKDLFIWPLASDEDGLPQKAKKGSRLDPVELGVRLEGQV